MSLLTSFKTAVHREPIIMWSFMIGGVGRSTFTKGYRPLCIITLLFTNHSTYNYSVGLALPLVVPPIREALGYGQPTPVNPPPVRQLIENARK